MVRVAFLSLYLICGTILFWFFTKGFACTVGCIFRDFTIVSPSDGTVYSVIDEDGISRGLYRAADRFGLVWNRVPNIQLSYSANEFPRRVELHFTRDGRKLFVRRGERELFWSDCIDVSVTPIRGCGRVRDCCMRYEPQPGITGEEGLAEDAEKMLAIAQEAGLEN